MVGGNVQQSRPQRTSGGTDNRAQGMQTMTPEDELHATIAAVIVPGKGILAADESVPTITKRFKALGIDCTDESRRAYRSLLITTPDAEQFLSGVILFEETLGQNADDGTPLPQVLVRRGIMPGIKVDKGTTPLAGAPGDLITQGLDGLAERLKTFKAQGLRFAKWREVYGITEQNPTRLGIEANAEVLARYAALCQAEGIVPIVEPEVLIDGEHGIERCMEVTEAVLRAVFHALWRHRVMLEYMVLKPNMVLPGKEHRPKATAGERSCRNGQGAAPNRACGGAEHQLPLRRPGPGRGNGQSQRDQCPVSACAVGAVVLVCAGVARSCHAVAGRAARKTCRWRKRRFPGAFAMNSLARHGKWKPEMEHAA